jgi:nucleotide-binding universal stress UspA family protein
LTVADRVVFLRPDAERIARAVRTVENGDRDESPLSFGRVVESGRRVILRVCTFSGSWGINSSKTLTFENVTTTPNTVSAVNRLFTIGDACETQVCYIGRIGPDWHLLNVQHPRCLPSGQYHQGPWDAEGQTAHREHIKACQDRLTALARGAGFGPGIEQTVEVIESQDAGKTIVAVATKLAADVICLSSHGYTGFRAIVLGSVAEAVLAQSTCPVFIIRQTG